MSSDRATRCQFERVGFLPVWADERVSPGQDDAWRVAFEQVGRCISSHLSGSGGVHFLSHGRAVPFCHDLQSATRRTPRPACLARRRTAAFIFGPGIRGTCGSGHPARGWPQRTTNRIPTGTAKPARRTQARNRLDLSRGGLPSRDLFLSRRANPRIQGSWIRGDEQCRYK